MIVVWLWCDCGVIMVWLYSGIVEYGLEWHGLVWDCAVRCSVVWCGVVWCGVVWCGVVWCGVVWCGMVWTGIVVYSVVWCVAVLYGVMICGWSSGYFEPIRACKYIVFQALSAWQLFLPGRSSFNTSARLVESRCTRVHEL